MRGDRHAPLNVGLKGLTRHPLMQQTRTGLVQSYPTEKGKQSIWVFKEKERRCRGGFLPRLEFCSFI